MNAINMKKSLDALELSDVYSLLLFVMYKIKDIPDYATLSELCYLADSRSLTRIMTYYAGKTITFPTAHELKIMTDALLVYNDVNLSGREFADAMNDLKDLKERDKREITELYLQIIEVMKDYRINRGAEAKDDR